ncbi:hypothetical protein [Mesobacillus zeae]|uniref:hypothetical protein n=1 Tax=Mesobacillus zeae TaxID=1917180 RepID=UPI00115D6DAF|nr:hypothetical protein [Mesobacillus zeae]
MIKIGNEQKIKVTPENFGSSFINEAFDIIYYQTSEEFKQLVTVDQFIEYGRSFNEDVEAYNLEMSTNLNKHLKQYLWMDNERKKVISVSFDVNNII